MVQIGLSFPVPGSYVRPTNLWAIASAITFSTLLAEVCFEDNCNCKLGKCCEEKGARGTSKT